MLKLDSNITTGFEELNLFGLNNKFNKGRRSPAGLCGPESLLSV